MGTSRRRATAGAPGAAVRGFAVVAAALAGAVTDARAEGGWWDAEPRQVPLERILADPGAYKDVPVVLTLQFHEKRGIFNPYYTPFTSDRYVNFSAWGDAAELWDRDQFKSVYPFFFVLRDDPFARRIADVPQRTRITCRAVVRVVFRGEPWIEVSRVEERTGSVGAEAVRAVLQGDEAFDRGDTEAALAAFRAALESRPGDGAAAAIHRRMARVHLARKDPTAAAAAVTEALRLNPDDAGALALRAAMDPARKDLRAFELPPGAGGVDAPAGPGVPGLAVRAPSGTADAGTAPPTARDDRPAVSPPRPEPAPPAGTGEGSSRASTAPPPAPAGAPPSPAPIPPPPPTPAPAEDSLPPVLPPPARCTFSVAGEPLGQAVGHVRRVATHASVEDGVVTVEDVRIFVAPEAASRPVTLSVTDLPWPDALERLAAAAGCAVAGDRPTSRLVHPTGPAPAPPAPAPAPDPAPPAPPPPVPDPAPGEDPPPPPPPRKRHVSPPK